MTPSQLASPALRRRLASLTTILLVLPILLSVASPAAALRVMTYNILNYPGSTGNSREDEFRTILDTTQPDLLIVQEMTTSAAPGEFLGDVLAAINPNAWALAPFVNGTDTDSACYYRTDKLDFLSHTVLSTALRNIDGWEFRLDGYVTGAAEFSIYSLHLKASQGSDNEAKRLAEATILRNHLNAFASGTNFIVGGDFNIYSSSEPAWSQMTGNLADNDGRVFDPINRVGSWHNNSSFADVHTQSPRITQFGGGANGGMDDRFDMLLVNDDLEDGVGLDFIPGSYTTYGQDGLHYNTAINVAPTNAAVGQAMADMLHDASDHIPLYMDLQAPALLLATGSLEFGPILVGTPFLAPLTIENSAEAPSADLEFTLSGDPGFSVSPTPVTLAAGVSSLQLVTVDTSTPATLSGNVTVTHDAGEPVSPAVLPASATVMSASEPSLDAASRLVSGAIDFGEQELGEFTPVDVDIYNVASVAPFALAEVTEAQITGTDAARFSVPGFTLGLVGAVPVTYSVEFDDTGATEGTTYSATLTFKTQDFSQLINGQTRDDLVLTLEATIKDTGTAVPGSPALATRLYGNEPNPFNPITTIRFDLARPGLVELSIFNAQGRLVRVLENRTLGEGNHRRIWDGRSDDGRAVASGVYFYRLMTDDYQRTKRMVLVR